MTLVLIIFITYHIVNFIDKQVMKVKQLERDDMISEARYKMESQNDNL